MDRNVNFIDVISQSTIYRKDKYIKYFFNNIADFDEKPIFDSLEGEGLFTLSIIKDSTSRILENSKGRLMEKSWRNCIFYFVDKSTYKKYFGTNSFYPNFLINKDEDLVEYDGKWNEVNSKNPEELRQHYEIQKGFQRSVFNIYRDKHSSWFVRSYVYFIMILCDDYSQITSKDFVIYYWNTNYSFKPTNGKKNIFNNVSDSYFVQNVLKEIDIIENANRDIIDCVNAYNGELDFRGDTYENYNDIHKDLEDGIEYILVEGAARTGKTIIALRLLGEFKDSVLLIMNPYFYNVLLDAFHIMKTEFPKDRIFHHSLESSKRKKGGWIQNIATKKIIPDLSFLIVDEAQRLSSYPGRQGNYRYLSGLDEIDKIVNFPNHKYTVFFGDDMQKLNPYYDKGFQLIYEAIKNRNFREYSFKKSIGIPPEILSNVKYLLNFNEGGNPHETNSFLFRLTKDASDFFRLFKEDTNVKKHFVCVGLTAVEDQCIDAENPIKQYPRELHDSDFNFLFNEEISNEYMLSTYEVISREIESVYLYLPDKITFNKDSESIEFVDDRFKKDNPFLIYHIYTLMTRATLKLTIFAENSDLYSHFLTKIKIIEQINSDIEKNIDYNTQIDPEFKLCLISDKDITFTYDVFIAYHNTNSPSGSYDAAKRLCDLLKAKGYSVFLNNYSFEEDDEDLGFDETSHALQRSKKMILVFNDNIYRDSNGMIPRKYEDKKPNQLYLELVTFHRMVLDNIRSNKKHLRYYYTGDTMDRSNIYNFLNRYYRDGTYGNSNCCFFDDNEMIAWMKA